MPTPQECAREIVNELLTAAGRTIQDYTAGDFSARRGIALREILLATGPCDRLRDGPRRDTQSPTLHPS